MNIEPICYLIAFAIVWHSIYSEFKALREYYIGKKIEKLREEAQARAHEIANRKTPCNAVDMNGVVYCPCGKRMN